MKIIQMLIQETNKLKRPGIEMVPQHITLYETDDTTNGSNALAHANLHQDEKNTQASRHYTVDSGDTIYQSIPDNEESWNGLEEDTNKESISIQICVNEDGDFNKAKANTVELIRFLMDKHNIPLKNVDPHWSGKYCPRNILASGGWDAFMAQVKWGNTIS